MEAAQIAREIGSECLCFRSRRVARVLTRHFDEALRPVGIQAPQLSMISVIAAAGEAGQSMAKLSDVLAMDPTTLSRNLRPLEKSGFIVIGRSERDRRVRLAFLTDRGKEVLKAALPLWRAAQDRLVGVLGSDAALELTSSLDSTAASAPELRAVRAAQALR